MVVALTQLVHVTSSHASSLINSTSGIATNSLSSPRRDVWELCATWKVQHEELFSSFIGSAVLKTKERPRRLSSHWAFPMPSTRTRQAPLKGRSHTRNAFIGLLQTYRRLQIHSSSTPNWTSFWGMFLRRLRALNTLLYVDLKSTKHGFVALDR